ncbi:MAG: acyltransferase [Bacteroidales bacterium]|nr:acyltransferase [Bacteroidales bacterium]
MPFVLQVGITPIVHYWSISVEEQFYLFWPWLARASRRSVGRLMKMAAVLCCVWLACKYVLYLLGGNGAVYRFFAATRFDCMMVGAMGAMLYFRRNAAVMRVVKSRWVGLVCLLLATFSSLWIGYIPAPVREQVYAVVSLGAILGQLGTRPLVSLENRVFDSVGKVSYGIYVVHPLLIILLSRWYVEWGLPVVGQWNAVGIYVGVTMVVYAVAWLSYRYVERPFLRLKDRFSVVVSRNSMR